MIQTNNILSIVIKSFKIKSKMKMNIFAYFEDFCTRFEI